MMRAAVLGLLLAFAVSLSSSAPILEDGKPLMWSQTVDKVCDLPKQNNVVNPNPWNVVNRMSLYRLLINATFPHMRCMGENATDSPFWGLSLQVAWLKSSGRLADPTGDSTCGLDTGDALCISPQSWWSCVNYFVSVLPFLSAAQQGVLGAGVEVKMQAPEGVEGYCTTYTECAKNYPDAMTKWDAFFQAVKTVNESQSNDERKDTLLGLYWDAQMTSIYASAACKAKQRHLSSVEVSFANGWLNSAEYISAAHFHSSLTKAAMYIVTLPSRVLKADDKAFKIADMTKEENQTLSIFSWMHNINIMMGGRLVSSWKSAMCSMEARAKGREMMEQLQLNPNQAMGAFVSIVTGLGGC